MGNFWLYAIIAPEILGARYVARGSVTSGTCLVVRPRPGNHFFSRKTSYYANFPQKIPRKRINSLDITRKLMESVEMRRKQMNSLKIIEKLQNSLENQLFP